MKPLVWTALLFFALTALGQASVPNSINYQGKLVDEQGNTLKGTTKHQLDFAIYDQVKDGISLWGKSYADVTVIDGHFNVVIGPFQSDLFTGADRFLEIIVDGTYKLEPRQQILSVPYAMRSFGDVPIGGIIPFWGYTADLPDNWMVCNQDNQTVTDVDSPMYGVTLPNLSGMFLRGQSSSDYPDQYTGGNDHVNSHSHSFSASDDSVYFPIKSGAGYSSTRKQIKSGDIRVDLSNVWLGAPVNPSIPYETHGHIDGRAYVSGSTYDAGSHDNRPRFFSLIFIIRIK
jgi:hypothetical protein